MPEGHTLHRLAKDLSRDLRRQAVAASSPQGRFAEGASRLDGHVVDLVEAYGKHLFCWFDSGDVLHIHLGLIGRLVRGQPAPTDQTRLRLTSASASWDLSGPYVCAVITPGERDAVVDRLGPDPLRRGASEALFVERFLAKGVAAGAALLDQTVIAGIGNVFRAELLFLIGVDPRRPANQVAEPDVVDLWQRAKGLMRLGVRLNRIVTVGPPDTSRAPGRIRTPWRR